MGNLDCQFDVMQRDSSRKLYKEFHDSSLQENFVKTEQENEF